MLGITDELEPSVLEPDKVIETLVVSDALPVIERGVTSKVGETLKLSADEGEAVGEGTAIGVILALPPNEIVEGGVSDGDGVRLCVEREVGIIELVIVVEKLEVGETVLEPVEESDPVSALEGVSLALAPVEIVDGGVEEGEGDSEGVGDDVEVGESLDDCVCVGVSVLESVPDPVPDPVKVGVTELLDVFDELAPSVTLVVGVAVFEEVLDALADAVSLDAYEELACAVESVDILASILRGAAAETVATIDVVEITVCVVIILLLKVSLPLEIIDKLEV